MNFVCKIITDRMGTFEEQSVTLAWKGECKGKDVVITPEEVEILFENGLIKNVARGKNGQLYQKATYLSNNLLDGVIVCGILAPSVYRKMRQEIRDYARKMNYISDTMIPVTMVSGTKSLIFNPDKTYNIFLKWHDDIMKKIPLELLDKFTRNYFKGKKIVIKSDGILLENLLEHEVFSRENIDLIREYDIQVFYLNPEIDKILLLRAVIQRAFVEIPRNMLRDGQFEKQGIVEIPENRQEYLEFDQFDEKSMNCGVIDHNAEYHIYTYQITVPYTEYIRETMLDTEKILNEKYGEADVWVLFSGVNQHIQICYGESTNSIQLQEIERDLIVLDYAMTLLRDENQFWFYQFYQSIISLLETDSSGKFKNEYF